MANEVRIRASVDDKVSGPLTRIRDKFDNLGTSGGFKALVQGVGMGVGVAALNSVAMAAEGAADFIGDSIKASSDLAESMSKAQVIFGPAAKKLEDFGSTAAHSLGMSKQAAIEAAATFGNFFTGIGQDKVKAEDMSEKLVTLAGDLASFNNIDPGTALEKLRSGLTGEAEPLRAVGVFLTEAKVKAQGMKMGLADAHGELSEGAKVLARYQIILDETATAQGDFARTSTGLANQQRIANADLINAQAELGESFKPIALQITEWQIDFIRGIGVAGDAWGQFTDGLSDFVDVITPWDGATSRAQERMLELVQSGQDMDKELRSSAENVSHGFFVLNADIDHDLEQTQESFGFASEAASGMADDMRTSTERARDYYDELTQGVIDDTRKLINDAFDPIETKLDAQGDHYEVLAGIVALSEAKSKVAHLEAKRSIISSLDAEAQHLTDLGQDHKLTKKQVETFSDDVKAAYHSMGQKVPPQIQRIINKLNTLSDFDGDHIKMTVDISQRVGIGGHVAGKKNAAGFVGTTNGPIMTGVGWMGEAGTEAYAILRNPKVISATAIAPAPKAKTHAAESVTQNFNLTVLGDVRARDPSEILTTMKRLKGIGTRYPIPGVINP